MDEKPMNFGQQLLGTILNPRETFKSVADRPRMLIPWLVIAVVNMIAVWLSLPATQKMTRTIMEKSGQYTSAQIDQAMSYVLITSIVSAVLLPLLISAGQAAVLKLYASFTVSEGTFKQLISVALFSCGPGLIGNLLKGTLLAVLKPNDPMAIQTSLALLLPKGDLGSFWFRFLAQFDFFVIWGLVLLSIGASVVLGKESKKTGQVVFGIWLIYVLVISLLGASAK